MEIFHLAIPVDSIEKAKAFYTSVFHATVGREYPEYVIFNFFGHQLVGHVDASAIPSEVKMYPRHFGVILQTLEKFNFVYENAKKFQAEFFEERFTRFEKKPGWHESFFLIDPSKNLVEIKRYMDSNAILS